MKQAIEKIPTAKTPLDTSIEKWNMATTDQTLDRVKDISRDKARAVKTFFSLVNKQPDLITSKDVMQWHQKMLDGNLSERYIYANLSHLSSYYNWLMKTELAKFLKFNPVHAAMPKSPKKYNSSKAKSLTDEELAQLWEYLENLSSDDNNILAVRDYAIFRIFTATGMRREEVINLGADDIRIEAKQVLIHTRVKGGTYEWRTIYDLEVKEAILRYLDLTNRKIYIGKPGRALWVRGDRGAEFARMVKRQENPSDNEPRLKSLSFDRQMKKYAHDAGIGHIHLHQFRHTFARIVAEEAGSINEVQEALGHKDLQTTQIYVSRIKFKKDKHSRSVRDRVKSVGTSDN